MINNRINLKQSFFVICGIFCVTNLAWAETPQFSVTTDGGNRVISSSESISNCAFPISLQSTSGLVRNETTASSIDINGNSTIFTFNHPVETNRPEIKLSRTINGCEAIFTILELQQPVSQFSLIVTPTVDGVVAEPLTVWEHFSLGPLPTEPESGDGQDLPPVEPPSLPTDIPTTAPFCSDEKVGEILNRIGVLSEEIRIHENLFNDLNKQQYNRVEVAWQTAFSLVEARNTLSRLEWELVNWQNQLKELEIQIEKNEEALNQAHEIYRSLQSEYVDEASVKVIENSEPLNNVDSGVTVSLDGGNTWLVLVGEKGLRKFLNEIRRDKDKGRQLHFRGQEVKRIQSVVFGLTSQKETATTAIDNIESSLENSRQTVSSLEQELGELKELRTELMSRQTDTSRQLEIFRQQLQEEELLLQSCEAFTSQPTSFIEMLIQKVAQFFRPLVLAYGGN